MISSIKYIVDDKGRKQEVVIPISMWEQLTKKDNKSFKMTKEKLASFEGVLFPTIDPVEYQRKMRDEWE